MKHNTILHLIVSLFIVYQIYGLPLSKVCITYICNKSSKCSFYFVKYTPYKKNKPDQQSKF